MRDKKGRHLFSKSMNKYRINKIYCLEKTAYRTIVELLRIVLVEVQKVQDIESAMSCMIFASTFYYRGGGPDKVYLHNSIMDHPFWKKIDFW